MSEGSQPVHSERYVIAERPRISASAILLLILIIMNAVSIFAAMSYWSRVQQLEHEVNLLRSEIRGLAKEIDVLNENIKHYKKIDELVELYIKQMVLKTYKELFPELSEEELRQLLEESIVKEEKEEVSNETSTVVIKS